MAQQANLPVRKYGTFPGSLGNFAGVTLDIGIVTFEQPIDSNQPTSQLLWQRYGNALIEAVVYPDTAK
jgi:murein peptide amidase A